MEVKGSPLKKKEEKEGMEGKEEKKSTQEVHLPSDQSSKIMSASVSSIWKEIMDANLDL